MSFLTYLVHCLLWVFCHLVTCVWLTDHTSKPLNCWVLQSGALEMQIRSLFSLLHLRLEGLKLSHRARFPKPCSLQQLEVPLFRLFWPPGCVWGPVVLMALKRSRAVYSGDGKVTALETPCCTHIEHGFVQ